MIYEKDKAVNFYGIVGILAHSSGKEGGDYLDSKAGLVKDQLEQSMCDRYSVDHYVVEHDDCSTSYCFSMRGGSFVAMLRRAKLDVEIVVRVFWNRDDWNVDFCVMDQGHNKMPGSVGVYASDADPTVIENLESAIKSAVREIEMGNEEAVNAILNERYCVAVKKISDQLGRLGKLCAEYDVRLVYDDAYEQLRLVPKLIECVWGQYVEDKHTIDDERIAVVGPSMENINTEGDDVFVLRG